MDLQEITIKHFRSGSYTAYSERYGYCKRVGYSFTVEFPNGKEVTYEGLNPYQYNTYLKALHSA